MKSLVLSAAFALAASTAIAGPQYIDETDFAVSGYDVVAYRSLTQVPVGQDQPEAVAGSADFTAEFNGAVFAFASAENRDTFLTDPAYFAPQFDGHCAYGVSRGGKVPANPHLWRIVDDKLYLNITRNVVGFWESDIPGNITLADGNWVDIEPKSASTRTIPNFMSDAPTQ